MENREIKSAHTPCAGTASACVCNVLVLGLVLSGCAGVSQETPVPLEQTVAVKPVATPAGPDADGDNVADALDRCENTALGHLVDEQGCELFSGKLENVEFQPDAFTLDASARQALDLLIARMNVHPEVVLAVGGHTDNRGNARDNLELSKKRVLAVVRYLVLNGVDGRRLHPHGYGESRPLFSNATAEGRSRNRRIEITQIFPD